MSKKVIFTRRTPSLGSFGTFGMKTLAYIKPIVVDGQLFHSIHAADGTPLQVTSERDAAIALVLQNELEPASVH